MVFRPVLQYDFGPNTRWGWMWCILPTNVSEQAQRVKGVWDGGGCERGGGRAVKKEKGKAHVHE